MTNKNIKISAEEKNLFSIMDKTLSKLGFKKDSDNYKEFLKGEVTAVKFINSSDSKKTITLNFNYKMFSAALLWSSKLSKTQENTILNMLLTRLHEELICMH